MPIPRHIGVSWFLQNLAKKIGLSSVPVSQYIPRTLDVVSTKSKLEKGNLEMIPLEFNQNIIIAEETQKALEKPQSNSSAKSATKNPKKSQPSPKEIETAQ